MDLKIVVTSRGDQTLEVPGGSLLAQPPQHPQPKESLALEIQASFGMRYQPRSPRPEGNMVGTYFN